MGKLPCSPDTLSACSGNLSDRNFSGSHFFSMFFCYTAYRRRRYAYTVMFPHFPGDFPERNIRSGICHSPLRRRRISPASRSAEFRKRTDKTSLFQKYSLTQIHFSGCRDSFFYRDRPSSQTDFYLREPGGFFFLCPYMHQSVSGMPHFPDYFFFRIVRTVITA